MIHVLTVFGAALMFAVLWLAGLVYAPYIVEKLFPRWSVHQQATIGVCTYLFLTGLFLVILGNLL